MLLLFLVSYLLGSIPFGLILAKLFGGADVRKAGSGNIGATNVLRVAGPAAGVLTLLLDAGKGWFAVWLAGRVMHGEAGFMVIAGFFVLLDRKSTRLNSSHSQISYAVFCLKKKK